MKFNKTRVIISLAFALAGCLTLVFSYFPPEFMNYLDGTWKIGTYFIGIFCIVASIYTVFYKGE